ncbi:MAG: DUF72 domain-containing protein, partial [Thermoanaerobaculia bacterium]|nr:DUF72 domain-containing protein [Thermoanaerobaculia bacterium]
MRLSTGTSGYSYKAWKGSFYPDDLADGEMLSYYASRLPAVEINNTFYRMPKESELARWADEVPESFRFALKVSRRITHFKRLRECEEELRYLLETVQTLGERLGALLFQLPPNFARDDERLTDFLDLLPPRCRAAFEFRHDSWFDEAVYDLLRQHRGATLCIAETDERRWDEIPTTGDWGYLRLRRDDYSRREVEAWAERIARQPWEEAYAFFKHEDAGEGPRLA